MAGIDLLLDKIMNARYGRDVRQSIHDAIKQAYDDGHVADVSGKADYDYVDKKESDLSEKIDEEIAAVTEKVDGLSAQDIQYNESNVNDVLDELIARPLVGEWSKVATDVQTFDVSSLGNWSEMRVTVAINGFRSPHEIVSFYLLREELVSGNVFIGGCSTMDSVSASAVVTLYGNNLTLDYAEHYNSIVTGWSNFNVYVR